MTEDKIQVDSDMTPLLCHVPSARVTVRSMSACSVENCFRGKRGCPYGQPKCSKDSYLVVRDNFWLSWTTGQPLLRTLLYIKLPYLFAEITNQTHGANYIQCQILFCRKLA